MSRYRLADPEPSKAPTLEEAKKMYRLREELMGILDDIDGGGRVPAGFNPFRVSRTIQEIDQRFMDFDHFADDDTMDRFNFWVLTRGDN